MVVMCTLISQFCRVAVNNCSSISFGSVELLRKLCMEGQLDAALHAVDTMEKQGIGITSRMLYSLLHVCINNKDLQAGRKLHHFIIRTGFEGDSFLGSHLIRMFTSCGSLTEANQVFQKLSKPSVFTWNAIILANSNLGQFEQAIRLYHEMCHSGMKPNGHIFVAVLKACTSAGSLKQGMLIHGHIIETGVRSDVYVGSSLVDMYARCGTIKEARTVFNTWPACNVVTWNTMIAGYAQHGFTEEALQLFQDMQQEGIEPNIVTWNIIISGYTQHGHINGALQNFHKMQQKGMEPNSVTWNLILAGYVQCGHSQEALQLFQKIQQGGLRPTNVTFLCILKACSVTTALDEGQKIHASIIESGLESDNSISNTLLDMYNKCGSLEKARCVFERLSNRSVVTWSAMIAGYAQHGHGQEALRLFGQMQQEGISPNVVTWNAMLAGYAQHGLGIEAIQLFQKMQLEGLEPDNATFKSILKACSKIAALDSGKLFHAQVIEGGFEHDVPVCNTLIIMYTKCGNLEAANTLFERLPNRNVVTWNAMITGCALHSEYYLALQYFDKMQGGGVKPDDVTFVSVLSTCSHLGLVERGCHHFTSMIGDHGITPRLAHYNCIVDLLGRVGYLNEAADLLHLMPFEINIIGWKSLLSNCRTHGDHDLGRHCFDYLISMDRRLADGYVHMSNIYADAEMRGNACTVQAQRKFARAWKQPGKAYIELDNIVHNFTVGEKDHSHIDEIYAKSMRLSEQIKETGHVPQLELVLQTLSEED